MKNNEMMTTNKLILAIQTHSKINKLFQKLVEDNLSHPELKNTQDQLQKLENEVDLYATADQELQRINNAQAEKIGIAKGFCRQLHRDLFKQVTQEAYADHCKDYQEHERVLSPKL